MKPISEWLEHLIEPYRTVSLECYHKHKVTHTLEGKTVVSLYQAVGHLPIAHPTYGSQVEKDWMYVFNHIEEFTSKTVPYSKYLK